MGAFPDGVNRIRRDTSLEGLGRAHVVADEAGTSKRMIEHNYKALRPSPFNSRARRAVPFLGSASSKPKRTAAARPDALRQQHVFCSHNQASAKALFLQRQSKSSATPLEGRRNGAPK